MKIAVVGTVGVPARYGGFETLAEQLAMSIDANRHCLVIYCQGSAYPGEAATPFNGHRRVFLPLRANGPASLVHDALALLHAALIANADAALILGYSGAWFLPIIGLLRPRMRIVTNLDGLEWRRAKFGRFARRVLRLLERFAIRFSNRVIADNDALVGIVQGLYGVTPMMIAYGGDHTMVAPAVIDLPTKAYALCIARVEPENNAHLILSAFARTGQSLVFVGNWSNSQYGRHLKQQYAGSPDLHLLDSVYDLSILARLRTGATKYVHGHSVGGTNPSLVEALFHHDCILAFDCVFNRATLDGSGTYFIDEDQLADAITDVSWPIDAQKLGELRHEYSWARISNRYILVIEGQESRQFWT